MVANWVYWRRVNGASKRIFATIKSTIDAVKFQIQYSYLHYNVINRLKYLMIFNRGIDTMKITALSNHKPGILNTYIRIDIIACKS